jgi:TolA-binding protein
MLRFTTCGLTILLATMRYKIGIAVGMLTLGLALCATDGAREQKYQRAVDLFESKGDAKGAMQLFEDVAKSPDRNLAARALLYIGACDEKVGEVGAQKAYERVVREFADQPAAAQARIRLAEINNASLAPAAITQRKIETAGRSFRTSDTDGQKVVYRDLLQMAQR